LGLLSADAITLTTFMGKNYSTEGEIIQGIIRLLELIGHVTGQVIAALVDMFVDAISSNKK